MDATIVDLRYRMRDVLRAIDRGETVSILYHGKRKAKLVPLSAAGDESNKERPRMADQPMFGMWKDREDMADPVAFVRGLREPRSIPALQGTRARRGPRKSL